MIAIITIASAIQIGNKTHHQLTLITLISFNTIKSSIIIPRKRIALLNALLLVHMYYSPFLFYTLHFIVHEFSVYCNPNRDYLLTGRISNQYPSGSTIK